MARGLALFPANIDYGIYSQWRKVLVSGIRYLNVHTRLRKPWQVRKGQQLSVVGHTKTVMLPTHSVRL